MGYKNSGGNPGITPRRGLPGMRSKLAGDAPLTAAFLGGSITEGAGASDADTTSWRALTGAYLQRLYAGHPVRCINAGVGGTTSTFGAHRLQEHVLRHGEIDLLFVEFSVNDGEDRGESIRGMEGIVRQCRRLSPETELIFVYTAADKNLTGYKPFNIAVHEEVADHYGIPSIDCAAKVYTMIHTGELSWKRFAPDGYHPLDAGHALYAGLVQEYLQQAIVPCGVQPGWLEEAGPEAGPVVAVPGEEAGVQETAVLKKEAGREAAVPGEEADAQETAVLKKETGRKAGVPGEEAEAQETVQLIKEAALPAPLDSRNYENGGLLDYSAAAYSAGFRSQELEPGEPLMNWRFSTEHAHTDDPQAEFSFTVTGQGAGLVLLYGPDSGIVEYSLNGGPYAEVNLFDDWCLNAYRPILALFPVQEKRGVLQVTIRNTMHKDSRSTGTGLRVLKLLYN
ncbi:SGNH/GDSL hydrolase family protein [Paenibacillus sp. IHB B 3415]|uniref:SGNH/GDSL hydrolase family protein n=1 Tax=Paenibacillus sp. IHB B 3415 TaxID=867080 RepID=UPI00069C20ED|nr:SGNH/GDSL hydrolase family protein [Paenibacillus sp. IHB B 3415]